MTLPSSDASLQIRIEQWRRLQQRRQAMTSTELEERETRLRREIEALSAAGLDSDEVFLIAVRRVAAASGNRELHREHSDRFWKALATSESSAGVERRAHRNETVVVLVLALAAAIAFKVPALFGLTLDGDESFYARNVSFFVLPLLTAYFAWKRQLPPRTLALLGASFLAAAAIVNGYPFAPDGSTEVLAALHLPIVLWFVVGVAYAGGRWNDSDARMDFVRFSGELFIYYVLIALGGGVFTGFLALIFEAIGVDVEPFLGNWLLPCGALGAVIVASWLVETRQRVMEAMAPLLTRIFTPLFAALLVTFLVTVLVTGRAIGMEREILIGFDLLLVVVLGLHLYSVSSRDPEAPPGGFDLLQVVLLVSALIADVLALWSIASRITELGFTPNRVAALGENVILLVNLAWASVLYIRFLRHRGSFPALERWQTGYLPVYAAWAAIVVTVFPPLFRFI